MCNNLQAPKIAPAKRNERKSNQVAPFTFPKPKSSIFVASLHEERVATPPAKAVSPSHRWNTPYSQILVVPVVKEPKIPMYCMLSCCVVCVCGVVLVLHVLEWCVGVWVGWVGRCEIAAAMLR